MQRSAGLVLFDANSCLVQHLNPACRVAQSFPHLSASRLIMSLNDYDLPTSFMLDQENEYNQNYLMKVSKYWAVLLLFVVSLVTLLPEFIQSSVMDAYVNTSTNILLVVIAFLQKQSWVAPVAISLIIASFIGYKAYKAYKHGFYNPLKHFKPANEDDDEEDLYTGYSEASEDESSANPSIQANGGALYPMPYPSKSSPSKSSSFYHSNEVHPISSDHEEGDAIDQFMNHETLLRHATTTQLVDGEMTAMRSLEPSSTYSPMKSSGTKSMLVTANTRRKRKAKRKMNRWNPNNAADVQLLPTLDENRMISHDEEGKIVDLEEEEEAKYAVESNPSSRKYLKPNSQTTQV